MRVDDDTGGGHSITGHTLLFMECEPEEAGFAFEEWTGQDPTRSTPEYGAIISMRSCDTLEEASASERACDYDMAQRKWLERPRPGYYRPFVPFEQWLAKQSINPSPEAMRETSRNSYSGNRYEQAAIASFALLGSVLLPQWVAGLRGEPNGILNPAQRLAQWAPALIARSESSALSPASAEDRRDTLAALAQAAEGLNLARSNEEAPLPMAELAEALDRSFEILLSAMGPVADKTERLAIGELLCETRLPQALGAFLKEHRGALSEPDARALLSRCQQGGFAQGEALIQSALAGPNLDPANPPRKPKQL